MDAESLRAAFAKERLERDVLTRIIHDLTLDPADFSLVYQDRFTGWKELPLAGLGDGTLQLEGDFLRTGDALIPLHRVREIRWHGGGAPRPPAGAAVWARRAAP